MAKAQQAPDAKAYLKESFVLYYRCYFSQLFAEFLLRRLQVVGAATNLTSALAAAGATTTGLVGWAESAVKVYCISLAGLATLLPLMHNELKVSTRVQEQEKVRHAFSSIRVDVETYREKLHLNQLGGREVPDRYFRLRERFNQWESQAVGDLLGVGLALKAQDELDRRIAQLKALRGGTL